jgi:prophage antirepressor-like protein
VLDIKNSRDAVRALDDDEKSTICLNDSGIGGPERNTINESGLYRLIIGSQLPDVEPFKDWVYEKVLPTIRKTGSYNHDPELARQRWMLELLKNPEDSLKLMAALTAKVAKQDGTWLARLIERDSGG